MATLQTVAEVTTTLAPTSPTIIKLQTIEPQTLSPLYLIPAEIRTLIFTHTLLASPDPSQPFSHTARNLLPSVHVPRVSYPHRLLLSLSLLSTCKRIYLEARHLPISLNEHVFWPRDFREPILPALAVYPIHTAPFFAKLTPWQQAAVKSVRFNIPEQGINAANIIIQKINRLFLKKKTTGLLDPGLELRGLRKLVLDCHNPVFGLDGLKYEKLREENMMINYGDAAELIREVRGLKEFVLILDYRPGSKVLGFVKSLDFGYLRLENKGGSEEVEISEDWQDGEGSTELKYVIRQLKWVA